MSTESAHLDRCVTAATERTRMIVRGVVNAKKSSAPIGWRKAELGIAISQSRALLGDLMLAQAQLGWFDEKADAS